MESRQQADAAPTSAIPQIQHRQEAPPPYTRYPSHQHTQPAQELSSSRTQLVSAMPYYQEKEYSRWNPRGWGVWGWITFASVFVVVVIAVILGAVLGIRANAYPSYSKLNYSLKDTYGGTSFFDNFDYFTGYDPSHGFVHYVDSAGAKQLNLTYATDTTATLRVDTSEDDASTGRKSVRITSKTQYDQGLFIFDVARSPFGCGTWPALWFSDPANWPAHGEIDVMEAVNSAGKGNQMTLHTTGDCKMDRKRKETGTVLAKDCHNTTDDNAGCGVRGNVATYGEQFNSNGGGVYAMELRSAGIRMWFFARANIPADITGGTTPDPSTWGTALADFPSTACDMSSHFKNQSIIANINLCGDWAGASAVYSTQYGCSGTCKEWVTGDGSRFDNAVWEFNSFKVYQAA